MANQFGLVGGSIRSILTPAGRRDWRYLDGNDGNNALFWAARADIRAVQEGTTPSYNLRSDLTDPGSPAATITLSALPTGWTFDGTTLAFTGTGQATTIVRRTATRLGLSVPEPSTFIVETIASQSVDTTPPTIVTRLAVTPVAAQGLSVSFNPGCDPQVTTANGLVEHRLYRDGSGTALATVASAAGSSPKLIGVDLGTVASAGSTTQGSGATGANYTLVSNGDGIGGTVESGQFAYEQVTGDFRLIMLVNNVTGTDPNRAVVINVRESLDPGARAVFFRINASSMRVRQRATANAATTSVGSQITGTWPMWLELTWSAGAFSAAYGTDRNNLTSLTSGTLSLATLYVGLTVGTGGTGIAVSADIQQYCRQNLSQVAYLDPILDGASHSYTVKSYDGANLSAASASVSATAPTSGVDTTPNAFTFTDQTGVALSSAVTSTAITVSGINAPSAISVTGGTYEINTSGTFTGVAGTVNVGDTVRVRHTSSASNSTPTNTVLTIGGISDTFTSTTLASGGVTIPTAPTGLGATGISTSAFSITFSSVAGATSYSIYQSLSPTGPFTLAPGNPVITASPYNHSVGGSPGTQWYFQLSASNAAGESPHPSVFSGTTLSASGSVILFPWANGVATQPGLLQTSSGTTGGTAHWRRESIGPDSTPPSLIVHPGHYNTPSPQAFHCKLQRLTPNNDFRVENAWIGSVPNYTPICYGFAVRPTSNWNYPKLAMVFQTHHTDVTPTAVQVPFAFYINGTPRQWGFWTIWHRDPYNGAKYVPSFPTLNRETTVFDAFQNRAVYGDAFHNLTLDVWTEFQLELCFDWDGLNPSNVGYQKIWKNDVLVVNRVAPMGIGRLKDTSGNPTIENQNNIKFGVYAVVSDTFTTGADTLEHYMSPIRIAIGANRRLEVAA